MFLHFTSKNSIYFRLAVFVRFEPNKDEKIIKRMLHSWKLKERIYGCFQRRVASKKDSKLVLVIAIACICTLALVVLIGLEKSAQQNLQQQLSLLPSD